MQELHANIDALSGTKTHEELVAATQKVLSQMAYYISQSEGVILDAREAWHDGSAAEMCAGIAADARAKRERKEKKRRDKERRAGESRQR